MNKPAPFLSVAGLFGGFFVCSLALHVSGRAQPPGPARPADAAPRVIPVANTEPGAGNVEAPSQEANIPAGDTEILASQGATFAAKDRIAVFTGDVRVRGPRFTLACDKLTVYLSKGGNSGGAPTPTPATPPPTGPDAGLDDLNRGGQIDHAVAEGHVVIVKKDASTKPGEEEKVSVCRSDTADYEKKTDEMTLRGTPKVEQNGNLHEALSRSTWMVLHGNHSLDTHGPSRTLFIPHDKDGLPGGKPAGTAPGTQRTQAGGTQN